MQEELLLSQAEQETTRTSFSVIVIDIDRYRRDNFKGSLGYDECWSLSRVEQGRSLLSKARKDVPGCAWLYVPQYQFSFWPTDPQIDRVRLPRMPQAAKP